MNSLEGSTCVSRVAEMVSRTEEWSEFRSRILLVEQCKLLGILAAKISRMSGFLFGVVGQYVGPEGGQEHWYAFHLQGCIVQYHESYWCGNPNSDVWRCNCHQ